MHPSHNIAHATTPTVRHRTQRTQVGTRPLLIKRNVLEPPLVKLNHKRNPNSKYIRQNKIKHTKKNTKKNTMKNQTRSCKSRNTNRDIVTTNCTTSRYLMCGGCFPHAQHYTANIPRIPVV